MGKRCKTELHSFYCINCGKKSMELHRKVGFQHGKDHRKKMWCPWCKAEINHIETRNLDEEFKFREAFNNGSFTEEAQESLDYVRLSCIGKNS